MTIRSGTSNYGSIHFSDATSGTGEYAGVVEYAHATDHLLYTFNAADAYRQCWGLLLGTTTEGEHNADNLTIADSKLWIDTGCSGSSSYGTIYFSDATSGNAEYDGYIDYNQSTSMMRFGTSVYYACSYRQLWSDGSGHRVSDRPRQLWRNIRDFRQPQVVRCI